MMSFIDMRCLPTMFLCAVAFASGTQHCRADEGHTDKTLVSWVTLSDMKFRSGSVLTLQRADRFDGIVFAELEARKWMAGSEMFYRSQQQQNSYADETSDGNTLVQMAIVYEGDAIRIYRDGKQYAAYEAKNVDLLSHKDCLAVFGIRHLGGDGNIGGAIEDARVYNLALTVDQVRKLRPNAESDIEPFAWWDFEGDEVRDRMGRFPYGRLEGGAKLANGQLILGRNAVLVAAQTEAGIAIPTARRGVAIDPGPWVEETPSMPDVVPETWLTYHLAHPGPGVGMPGDPNCAFYYKGRYHLHYIYNHRHGFAFAHVSSTDMVHWKWHPTVLVRATTGHGMFSGTGFFTKQGQPAIIYHGEGSGRNQIAVAEDDQLDKWSKPWPLEPIIQPGQDESLIANWDPDAWLEGDTYYALSGGSPGSGKPPTLFKSSDLKRWDYLGLFLTRDMQDVKSDEDISCPNFFRIGNKQMLLCISHTLGCRYYLGEWKNEKFTPEFHARMNWKDWNFFAPESLVTADGRRVMWAWCRFDDAAMQSGIQSLPRELSLPDDGVLRIKPLKELESLRYDEKKVTDITVRSGENQLLSEISGDTLELDITIRPTTATSYGVSVFCDKDGNGFPITIHPQRKVLTIGSIAPPFELASDEETRLRIFLDKSMVEVFVNDRQAAVFSSPHDKANAGIRLFSEGDAINADVRAWKMKSIYEGVSDQ